MVSGCEGELNAFLWKFGRRRVLGSASLPLYHAWIPMWSGPVVLLLSPGPVRGKWFHLAFRVSWFYQQWPLSSSLSLKLSPFMNAVFSYPPLPSTSLHLLSKYTGLSNSLFAMPSSWGAPNVVLIPTISQLHPYSLVIIPILWVMILS